MKMLFLVATKDRDGDWQVCDPARDSEMAHADGRYLASKNPGKEFAVFQLVGTHVAPVLTPRYTAADSPEPLRITAGSAMNEDMLR